MHRKVEFMAEVLYQIALECINCERKHVCSKIFKKKKKFYRLMSQDINPLKKLDKVPGYRKLNCIFFPLPNVRPSPDEDTIFFWIKFKIL